MAGWVKLAGRSFGVAALVGAAQLGAAQALAMLVWSAVPTSDVWRRQLTWLVFIFAAAVLGGVAGGRRSVRSIRRAIANRRADAAAARHAGLVAHRRGLNAARKRAVATARNKTVDTARGVVAGATRVGATVFAALGAAASFALVWLPARNAYTTDDVRVLATSAGIGIGVGAVLSLLSLTAAPIAANVGVWLFGPWLFGLASVGVAIATDQPTRTPRLGVLDAPHMIGPDEWWLGPNLMVAVAAVFGVAVAATARWVGAHRLAIALSGLAGPSVVAAAYLVVGPAGELMSSYIAALLAATIGLLTSAATAAAHRGTGDAATTTRTPAALTAGAAAPALRRPLAIESGRAAQYPAAAPGRVSSARTSAKGRHKPGTATPPLRVDEPGYASAEALYLAPARSAPVPPARVSPPARPQRTMPPPTPVPPVSAWPPAPPTRTAPTPPAPAATASAPAAPPPAAVASKAPASKKATTKRAARKSAERKPAASAPAAVKPAASAPAAVKPAASAPAAVKPASGAPAAVQPAAASQPAAAKPAGRGSRRGRSERAKTPAPARLEAVAKAEAVPRTTRPAEVVAVEASRPGTATTPPEPKGRRARRRAARLAAERAEAEARLTRQMEREATMMNKREKEHVDWVKHLVSLPNDPTLTTRQK